MHLNNPAIYGCPKGGENGIHKWHYDDQGIATCSRCELELGVADSLDLKRTDDRFLRELEKR